MSISRDGEVRYEFEKVFSHLLEREVNRNC